MITSVLVAAIHCPILLFSLYINIYFLTVIKEKLNEEKKLKESYINLRQEASKLVYKDWLKTVPSKPKPVPLNKGFYSKILSIIFLINDYN